MSTKIVGAAIVLAVFGAGARAADANPLQLTFQGNWTFYDPQSSVPTFWAALTGYGVTQGTPLTFSMIIDGSAAGTTVGAGARYAGAIQQVNFTAGSLSLGCGGTACSHSTNGSFSTFVSPNYFGTGPSMSGLPGIGQGFLPSFFNFQAATSSGSSALTGALANPGSWQSLSLLVGFTGGPNGPGGGGIFLGTSQLTFVKSMSDPETTSMASAVTGCLLLAGFLYRRTTRRKLLY